MADELCVDYVVLHELAHTLEQSQQTLLDKTRPDDARLPTSPPTTAALWQTIANRELVTTSY
jgi:hypothetical protein